MANCSFNTASETTADFIYHSSIQDQPPSAGRNQASLCLDSVSQDYSIVYVPLDYILPLTLEKYSYYSIPKLFTLMDTSSMDAAGITPTFTSPALSGKGAGTIIGLIDTGIDYVNPLFRGTDGSTRILGLWDQTLPQEGMPPGVPDYYPMSGASYGTEYTREQINQALNAPNPYDLVPSRDTNGHGTFLAGIAAGGPSPDGEFTGAAPGAWLGVVKLKPAKQYLRDFYLVPQDAPAYQENDIMMAVKYLRVLSHRTRMPLVILLGLGSNMGSQGGLSPLSAVLQDTSRFLGIVSVAAAGNETGLAHHYEGNMAPDEAFHTMEIRVGEEESLRGFVLEIWSSNADVFTAGFVSPTGEVIQRIPLAAGKETRISFLLEETVIYLSYRLSDEGSGRQLIFIRFEKPAAGIWQVRVYSSLYFTGQFQAWLPIQHLISQDTIFLRPSPYSTISLPGRSPAAITAGAYDHLSGSIYIHSSRGFTLDGQIKPDLAAPGVNVYGPGLGGVPGNIPMTRRSGTSVAAAHMAGAAAILLGWGLAEGNDPSMSAQSVRTYLIRGASRSADLTYPNREWGYGILNLYQAFLRMRE